MRVFLPFTLNSEFQKRDKNEVGGDIISHKKKVMIAFK